MIRRENFINNIIYILLGLFHEYEENKDAQVLKKGLHNLKCDFSIGKHTEHRTWFKTFIENRIGEIKEDITYIKRDKKIQDIVLERFGKFIKLDVLSIIDDFDKNYFELIGILYPIADDESNCEFSKCINRQKSSAECIQTVFDKVEKLCINLADIVRQIGDCCEELKDIERDLLEYNEEIWNDYLTNINKYTANEEYCFIVHSTLDGFNQSDYLINWVNPKEGFLCCSLITSNNHSLYRFKDCKFIAGYGFVLKMKVYELALISKSDNYTNYSLLGQGINSYRENPYSYFLSQITNISMSSPLETSITKTPRQILENSESYNEIVFDFQAGDHDLIEGTFCMINKSIEKNDYDEKFIQEIKEFSNKNKLNYVELYA